jgi:thiamine biosynthesis lipoprotein
MTQLDRYEYSAPSMGTNLKLAVYAESEHKAQRAIDAGLAEIERLIPIVNNYDPDSEISRLSSQVRQKVRLSPDLSAVFRHARRWHEISDGAFDVTIGPLTRLWSQARRDRRLPVAETLDAARSRMGWQHVRWFDGDASKAGSDSVELLLEGMRIDISGMATGYILDRAFEAIRQVGIESLLIDVGGDIRVGKAPPGSDGWRIDIAGLGTASPRLSQRRLVDGAITTSGDLNQFVEIDGVRYSHLIDPRSGDPVPRRQSATAIAATALDADAGATALCVLGMERSPFLFEDLPLHEGILLEAEMSDPSRWPVRYRHLIRDRALP